MKPPVEEVRVSAQSKEILAKIKKRTGINQWNYLCRLAYCQSLREPLTNLSSTFGEVGVRMDWKTFSGQFSNEFISLNLLCAKRDNIDLSNKEILSEYFRTHLERGVTYLKSVKDVHDLIALTNKSIS